MATNEITIRGSVRTSEPRTVGDILHEFVNTSDSPLAKEYRSYLVSNELAEKGGHNNE